MKPSAKYIWGAVVALMLVGAGVFFTPPATHHTSSLSGPTMGTLFQIKFISKDGSKLSDNKINSLKKSVKKRLTEINRLMSTWDRLSEISKFNQFESKSLFEVSKETYNVVMESLRLSNLSEGAFDITIGPVVNAWGFGPIKTQNILPDKESLEKLREITGADKLKLAKPYFLEKTHPSVNIDLSAIAKGYGVDEVASILEKSGIFRYLVEIGGEMRVRGLNSNGMPWRVGIEKPEPGTKGQVDKVVPLKDLAIATSGSYRNYKEKDGKRYSHTIDPITLAPITHKLVSVSVIDESAMTADGLATALMVMGEDKGFKWAKNNQIRAYFIVKTKSGYIRKSTCEFKDDGEVIIK